jgi:hypothetical protein
MVARQGDTAVPRALIQKDKTRRSALFTERQAVRARVTLAQNKKRPIRDLRRQRAARTIREYASTYLRLRGTTTTRILTLKSIKLSLVRKKRTL